MSEVASGGGLLHWMVRIRSQPWYYHTQIDMFVDQSHQQHIPLLYWDRTPLEFHPTTITMTITQVQQQQQGTMMWSYLSIHTIPECSRHNKNPQSEGNDTNCRTIAFHI
jgi:hypothetical protein